MGGGAPGRGPRFPDGGLERLHPARRERPALESVAAAPVAPGRGSSPDGAQRQLAAGRRGPRRTSGRAGSRLRVLAAGCAGDALPGHEWQGRSWRWTWAWSRWGWRELGQRVWQLRIRQPPGGSGRRHAWVHSHVRGLGAPVGRVRGPGGQPASHRVARSYLGRGAKGRGLVVDQASSVHGWALWSLRFDYILLLACAINEVHRLLGSSTRPGCPTSLPTCLGPTGGDHPDDGSCTPWPQAGDPSVVRCHPPGQTQTTGTAARGHLRHRRCGQ